jgi:hypothetical protein
MMNPVRRPRRELGGFGKPSRFDTTVHHTNKSGIEQTRIYPFPNAIMVLFDHLSKTDHGVKCATPGPCVDEIGPRPGSIDRSRASKSDPRFKIVVVQGKSVRGSAECNVKLRRRSHFVDPSTRSTRAETACWRPHCLPPWRRQCPPCSTRCQWPHHRCWRRRPTM